MSKSLIELKNVTMKFGGVTALSDVTFDVKEKEILGLIGPNGAGKTTVFNVITGVYQITSGEIIFDGKSLAGVKRYKITKRGVARTFQNIRLWGDMTALENVMTAADTHKKSGLVSGLFGFPISRREEKRDKARAQELLDFIGIGEYSDRLAKNLPYGVQRRLEIARAMGAEPKLLLLDEPSLGLAPLVVEQIIQTVNDLSRKSGLTVLLVEQNANSALAVADYGVLLSLGKVVANLPAAELKADASLRAAYLGY